MSTLEARNRASRNDYSRNKESRKIKAYHRQARLYIRNYADDESIKELRELLNQREENIRNNK